MPSVEQAPIVAISIATSGIHPTTSRAIALAMVFYEGHFDPEERRLELGEEVQSLTRRLNPGEDVGPRHLHGYLAADLAQSKGFPNSAQLIYEALNERTIILHQAGMTWGFITHEFRRAQRAANRNRRNRGRSRSPRKVPTPQPTVLFDTLGTARRQSTNSMDSRLRAIAAQYDLHLTQKQQRAAMAGVEAKATTERVNIPADDLLLADAHLIAYLAHTQSHAGTVSAIDPDTLVADPFGIQRSTQRVQAARASRRWVNPGAWQPGQPLVQGMEFVISPDVAIDPNILIDKAFAAGLAYSEKLNRRSSLVVCNQTFPLRGKSMHADRKNIPLITDTEFLELLDNVEQGTREPKPVRAGTGNRPRTSASGPPKNNIPAPRTTESKNKNKKRRKRRRRSQKPTTD